MVESTPALEAYAAVLSGGPVGPSDQVGKANKSLIMATWYLISHLTVLYYVTLLSYMQIFSMIDGLLLRPSRPALSIDSTFVQRAFGSGGPNGHIVATYTEVIQWERKLIITCNHVVCFSSDWSVHVVLPVHC